MSTVLLLFIREEFHAHGISDIVTICHRNVCKDGFTVADEVDAGTSSLIRSLTHVYHENCGHCNDLPLLHSVPRSSCTMGCYLSREEGFTGSYQTSDLTLDLCDRP